MAQVAGGLASAQALEPGHGQVIAGVAASLSQQFLGAQLEYKQHFLPIKLPMSVGGGTGDLSAFANAFAGVSHGVPDLGAMAGLKFQW